MLNVVEDIPDAIDGDFLEIGEPFVDDLEDALVLVSLADVFDDVLTVRAVDAQHLSGVALVLELLKDLCVNDATQLSFPIARLLDNDARESDTDDDKELLVNVEHQVLQVGVDACLSVNSGLLVGEQVIELNNSDRDGFELLGLKHNLFKHGVLDYLVSYNCREMARFRHIPPVVAVKRCIQVVSQTLHRHTSNTC